MEEGDRNGKTAQDLQKSLCGPTSQEKKRNWIDLFEHMER